VVIAVGEEPELSPGQADGVRMGGVFRFGRRTRPVNGDDLRRQLADAGITSLINQLSDNEPPPGPVEVVVVAASAIMGWNHQETFKVGQRILVRVDGLGRPALLLELRSDQTAVVELSS
jgi:hypothetical protein